MTISDFIRTIKATWLCIRFPFLYPRNRYTGLHYNNWEIINLLGKFKGFQSELFFLSFKKESEIPKDSKRYSIKDKGSRTWRLNYDKNSNTLFIGDINRSDIFIRIDCSNMLLSGEILDFKFIDKNETVIISEDAEINGSFSRFYVIDLKENILKFIIRTLEWIHNYPLQLFHCFTSYTELDMLDSGWRKRFGISICKEIRSQLLKEGNLFNYRITQIKEKYGSLRWYDNGSKEIQKIISKYEELSSKTCIDCGKDATRISCGYVCPYCDDCIGDRKSIDIKEY